MANLIFLTAEWRKLAMANYPADPALLRTYVPRGTPCRYDYTFKVDETALLPLFEKVRLYQETALGIIERITR